MDRDRFLTEVRDRAPLDDRDDAEEATEAVLSTLAERITAGEAEDLASQLPTDLAEHVATDGTGEQFDFEEFTGRVSERTDFDDEEPAVTQGVVSVVVDATTPGQLQDVVSQFPENEGYGDLLARADEASG